MLYQSVLLFAEEKTAMNDNHLYRVAIPSVPEGVARPLWSVMIPTYNCAQYLRETLACVLAQDLGPAMMQIEVVDDHSTRDDPKAVVRELGGDRVGFYRQPENSGHVRNFNTCILRSRGHLVHILHGDDIVREGFYHKLGRAFAEHPAIGSAFCRSISIDERGHWRTIADLQQEESGILQDWLPRIVAEQRVVTPAVVVRRDVYERLGGFDSRIRYFGEDWDMWIRIAANFPVWYEVEPLALYRMHGSSLTGRFIRDDAVQDMRQVLSNVRSELPLYVPAAVASKLLADAGENVAWLAAYSGRLNLEAGAPTAALKQFARALQCSRSWPVLYHVMSLFIAAVARWPSQAMASVARPSHRRHSANN